MNGPQVHPYSVPPRPRGPSWMVYLLAGLGAVLVLLVIVAVVSVESCVHRGVAEGGVRLSNEIPASVVARIGTQHVLLPNEELTAYYDVSVTTDGSEYAALTNARVLYVKGGRVSALELEKVSGIDHREQPLVGTIIEIHGRGGESMKIEVAPLNGGETMVNALERAVAAHERSTEAGVAR